MRPYPASLQKQFGCSRTPVRETLTEREQHESTGDADGYYYANARFHGVIYDACGNQYLREQAHHLRRVLQPYRRLQLWVPDRMRRSLGEHRSAG